MLRNNLRITEADWNTIRRHCRPSFTSSHQKELGVIGIIGARHGTNRTEYLVSTVLLPQEGEVVSDRYRLQFSAQYIRRAHLAARSCGAAGLIVIHTHPFATDSVSYSSYDDTEEPQLAKNLREIHQGTVLTSMVLGAHCQAGRVWVEGSSQDLDSLIVVGERLAYLSLDGEARPVETNPAGVFDAGLAITGAGALATLANMTVAVVGASGTGSLMCELLARAGCRQIFLIDFDVIEKRNLNRVLHSRASDADNKRKKVAVLQERIEALGLPTKLTPIDGSVLDRTILSKLNDCDLIVGCVDRAYPRVILSQYSIQHLIPYVDLGTEIGTTESRDVIASVDTRVTYVCPNRPCLRCVGLANPRRLAYESTTGSERDRIKAHGYSDDLEMSQPAVMDLNMVAAGHAMSLIRHLLQPYMDVPLPSSFTSNLVMGSLRRLVKTRSEHCDICAENPNLGLGDCGKVLGLESQLARRLL